MKYSIIVLIICVMSGFLNAQTRVREGSNPYGTSLYNWDGKYLKEGHSSCNKTLINWDGKNIRESVK